MTTWVIGLVCNAIIAVVYMLISLAIVVPLAQEPAAAHQPARRGDGRDLLHLRGAPRRHTVHMLLPAFGRRTRCRAWRCATAWGWPLAIWDVIGALVGVYYWTLRRNYASLMQGAKLFEDMRKREQQALELNDNVLQGLVVAKMALDLDEPEQGRTRARAPPIDSASRMITDLLGSEHFASTCCAPRRP